MTTPTVLPYGNEEGGFGNGYARTKSPFKAKVAMVALEMEVVWQRRWHEASLRRNGSGRTCLGRDIASEFLLRPDEIGKTRDHSKIIRPR